MRHDGSFSPAARKESVGWFISLFKSHRLSWVLNEISPASRRTHVRVLKFQATDRMQQSLRSFFIPADGTGLLNLPLRSKSMLVLKDEEKLLETVLVSKVEEKVANSL